jgi:uncharacterized protein (DUF983 family)
MTQAETREAGPLEWRAAKPQAKRDLWRAMRRGAAGRCPACGRGAMFTSYLKVAPHCPACGEDLSHHRADDAPPYVVISIVGHVVVFGIMIAEAAFETFSYGLHLMIWPPVALAMSLAMLQPVKGALIGLQWALRMHGFGEPSPGGRRVDFAE